MITGNGYSSKPKPCDPSLLSISGENGRADVPLGLNNIELGTAKGGSRVSDIQLAHPLGSIYNFYTWAEQITEFVEEVIKPSDGKVSLVCNSIGTISSLQASIDRPDIFDSCFIINPNFRELHVAESPAIIQPLVRGIQTWLRKNGQPIFNALATPETVKNILKEPYAIKEAVTDELVDVLLSPLLQAGSADVVFDTLSYSAGPLPEQQLQDPALNDTVIEICYGDKDPWTPLPRVQALSKYHPVKNIEALKGFFIIFYFILFYFIIFYYSINIDL
jgi:pimeloyl-ACP methyl ester carboxylesterase